MYSFSCRWARSGFEGYRVVQRSVFDSCGPALRVPLMMAKQTKPENATHWSTRTNFLKPSSEDLWEFMQKMKAWLIDSNRKGIPA